MPRLRTKGSGVRISSGAPYVSKACFPRGIKPFLSEDSPGSDGERTRCPGWQLPLSKIKAVFVVASNSGRNVSIYTILSVLPFEPVSNTDCGLRLL